MDKHLERKRKAVVSWLKDLGFETAEEDQPYKWAGSGEWGADPKSIVATLNRFTGQGDYMGGTVERSNREVMEKEFPQFLEQRFGGYYYYSIAVSDVFEFHKAFRWPNHPHHDKAVSLVEGIEALHDYPLWDEDHHSELEMKLIHAELPEAVEDVWKNATGSWDVDLIPFPDELKEKIEAALEDREGGSHCPIIETGCLVHFVDAARKKATEIAKEYFVKWESEIREAVLEDEEVRDDLVETEITERYSLPVMPTDAQEAIDKIQQAIRKGWNPIITLEEIGRILNHPGVPS